MTKQHCNTVWTKDFAQQSAEVGLASVLDKDNASRTRRDTRCLSVLLHRSLGLVVRATLLSAWWGTAGIPCSYPTYWSV